MPGEIIVKFDPAHINLKQTNGMKILSTFADKEDLVPTEFIVSQNIALVQLETGSDMTMEMASLQADPNVEYVQPNFLYTTNSVPDDTYFARQR
jgi:hypothetical protein